MSLVGNTVGIPVPDIDAVLVDYDRVRLYRASSRSGSYSLLTTITIATPTTNYSYQDSTGAVTSWYRWSYYNSSSTAETAQGEPFPAVGALVTTRQTLRRLLAYQLACYDLPPGSYTFPGPSGTTTSNGSSSALVCSDYADSLLNENVDYKGHYLLINDGTCTGDERRVASVIKASGTFTPARNFSGTPGTSATFDLYAQAPSAFWNACLFDDVAGAHLDLWTPFQFPITGPAAGDYGPQRQFALPYYVQDTDQVLRVTSSQVASGETALNTHLLIQGQHYELRPLQGGGVELYLSGGLAADLVLLVEGYRTPAPLASDSDTITLAESQQRLLVVGAAVGACDQLMKQPDLGARDRSLWKTQRDELQKRHQGLVIEAGSWKNLASPRRDAWVGVTGTQW